MSESAATLSAMLRSRNVELPRYGWRTHGPGFVAIAVLIGLFFLGVPVLGISFERFIPGLWRLGDIVMLMMPPSPETWSRFFIYLEALGQTLAIAFLGTMTAAVFAIPLGFLAARNIVANRIVHFFARRLLDTVRSVDTLIWALIWINVVGLGPFAGALAIASADICALAKLMSEAIETADRRPVEGVTASGGSRAAAVRFGIVPQVLPVFASQVLYYIESNTRSATIIGIVGAGGIGVHLSEMIRVLEWQQVSFLILMVLVTVAIIDQISRVLRKTIAGRG
ncbi:MAG: phosphonate ABC transporter, permease protein PhnE [Alphaproteobacteria bacterium]|nr:phosphonate ABC transporter, permease protein PhnE [Alphaproteobacteria bacterium]